VESESQPTSTPLPPALAADHGSALEHLADFAAGMAHELNNQLAAVLSYAQLRP